MTLKELDYLREQNFTNNLILDWVDPRLVTGVNSSRAKKINWSYHHTIHNNQEEYPDDDIIVEYLTVCLRQNTKRVSAIELVDAAIYLITTFWSSDASVFLSNWNELLNHKNLNKCICMIKQAFETSQEWPAKALLRNFAVDFFRDIDDIYRHNPACLVTKNAEFISFLKKDRNYVFSNPPKNLKMLEFQV